MAARWPDRPRAHCKNMAAARAATRCRKSSLPVKRRTKSYPVESHRRLAGKHPGRSEIDRRIKARKHRRSIGFKRDEKAYKRERRKAMDENLEKVTLLARDLRGG